jgi:transposase-like protein/DDE family transposase
MEDQACTFGELQFGNAVLGDKRRMRRLVKLGDTIVRHPGGTLPDKVNDPANLKALYRLMNCNQVTHASVIKAPCDRTREKMATVNGTVLILHDSTELDFSGLLSIETLGQLGNGKNRGYVAHNSLAVVAKTREVLGLANQHLVKRAKVTRKESRKQCRNRADRESRWWTDGSKQIPCAPAGKHYVEIGDRGSDILEFLDYLESVGKKYVVRSQHNRLIELENGEKTKLHDFARQLSEQGRRTVEVGATDTRSARIATVSVSWARVTLRIPRQPRGEVRGVPLTTWVVYLREIDAPEGVEPIEWILLTNVPVHTFEEAGERIDWYSCRWIIEEYHKGLKTGCQIEDMQFTTEAGLQPAIALISVVAVHLLQLRDISRRADAHALPATQLFPASHVAALSQWRYHEQRTDLTVHDFCYALARLGGHQNRKCDHRPGWLVLWRGWTKLQLMAEFAPNGKPQKCGQT